MSDFQPGEIVDITIKGARVHFHRPEISELTIDSKADANTELTTFDLACEQVTVERVAPAEWPPQPDDLWKHRLGALLFAMGSGSNVVLKNSSGGTFGPTEAWEMRHDLTLVHREGGDES